MGQRGLLNIITSRQALFAMAMIAAMVIVSAISSIVSAATLSERSVMPSSAAVSATGVQYAVEFTPQADASAFVVDFCDNSPLIGQSCEAPAGLSVQTATTATSGVSIVGTRTANKLVATKAMEANEPEVITFTGITNPSSVGTIFARILTFEDSAAAEAYASDTTGAVIDSGSVAMYFNSSVAVSGTVLETLTFCLSGEEIGPNCSDADAPAAIILGQETAPGSGVYALEAGVLSEGTLHTQINTNAVNGAVVRLRSSAACGGLVHQGTGECSIAAALDNEDGIDGSEALFGVRLVGATEASGGNPVGIIRAFNGTYYGETFAFRYVENNQTGVTSAFGDEFLDTGGAPATDQNMELSFGATITNETPAGTYSTDISMIAVGKF